MAQDQAAKLTAFAAVFTVKDVAQAIAHYIDRLGFKVEFKYGDPVQYAAVERDNVSIHLMPLAQSPKTLGLSSVYVFTGAVDALHKDLLARGATIELPPKDYEYGMREMSVLDPDGNRLSFGQPTTQQ